MTTLYQQIELIARTTVKHYMTDVTTHDKSTLAKMRDYPANAKPPSKIWQETMVNRSIFRAVNDIWPGTQWYLLTARDDDGNGSVVKIGSVMDGEDIFVDRIYSLATPMGSAITGVS